jgi:hypothetical protein
MEIKLFEDFMHSGNEFSADINKDKIMFDLINEPMNLKGADVKGGLIKWDLNILRRNWGYELGGAKIISMDLIIEMEDEEGEGYTESEINVPEDTMSSEQFSTEINNFPLALTWVTIDMRHSKDPIDWKVTLTIGSDQD